MKYHIFALENALGSQLEVALEFALENAWGFALEFALEFILEGVLWFALNSALEFALENALEFALEFALDGALEGACATYTPRETRDLSPVRPGVPHPTAWRLSCPPTCALPQCLRPRPYLPRLI